MKLPFSPLAEGIVGGGLVLTGSSELLFGGLSPQIPHQEAAPRLRLAGFAVATGALAVLHSISRR